MLWTPATLRPLVDQLVPVAEQLDIRSLRNAAAKVSTEALALVRDRAAWNPMAKMALQESAAAVGAKYANLSGVSAEYAPEVQLGLALASILGGRMLLLQELKELAAEKRERDKAQPKKEADAAQN